MLDLFGNHVHVVFFFSLAHWDVNNENLHGDFYEMKTQDPNITMKMFEDIHAVDPDVKLFLNDYGIIEQRPLNLATVGFIHFLTASLFHERLTAKQ